MRDVDGNRISGKAVAEVEPMQAGLKGPMHDCAPFAYGIRWRIVPHFPKSAAESTSIEPAFTPCQREHLVAVQSRPGVSSVGVMARAVTCNSET